MACDKHNVLPQQHSKGQGYTQTTDGPLIFVLNSIQFIKSDINTCIGLSNGVCQEYLTIIPPAQMGY